MSLKVITWTLGIMALLLVTLWTTMALSYDYWTTCEEAYEFCARRSFHRDCAIWTGYGQELSKATPNPMYGKQPEESPYAECRDNPGNPACPNPADPYTYSSCPIPDKYK